MMTTGPSKVMQWQRLGSRVPRRRNRVTRWLGRAAIRIAGWKVEGDWPDEPKLIVAVSPHSSNMDFILSVAVFWALDLKTGFLAKQSLFWFPLGAIMRGLGGIPIDRGSPGGVVEQLTARFDDAEQLVIGITPEGTRGKVREWKSGFARIAAAAQVPVLPAIVNYAQKIVYLRPVVGIGLSVEEVLAATRQAASAGFPRNP
jgi:1-acyl-sn-glycerol-3-phosphate acyltransferase